MDSPRLKDQDVSDLLAKDLVKRLIENDHVEDTERKAKKIKNFKEENTKKSNYDAKYMNKTPDEIIENTLKELSSLNDLLNHAIDKSLGLNELTDTSIDLNALNNQASSSNDDKKFDDFKVPDSPFKSSIDKSSRNKSSSKSFENSSSSKHLSSENSIENDLFRSIIKEVINQGDKFKLNETEDEDELKHKKKKKKKDKHTHHCRKHRKRKLENGNQSSPMKEKVSFYEDDCQSEDRDSEFKGTTDLHSKDYEENKYYSAKKLPHKKSNDIMSSGSKFDSDDEYDERSRKYSSNKYKSKQKHHELESRPYDERYYEYSKNNRYEEYNKNYEKSYDRYESKYNRCKDDKISYKDQFHIKKLRSENSISDWTKFCSKISKEQENDNSSIESQDFYSDDDDTRSMMSERILNQDAFKTKEIKFEVRDFKTRQARTVNEIKNELLDLFPVSSGANHQWKEVDKVPEKKPNEKSKKVSKSIDTKDQDLENKLDEFLNKHVQNIKSSFDIGSIMSQRLCALKILANDANNITALNQLKESDALINEWSSTKSTIVEEVIKDQSIQKMSVDNQTYELCSDFTKAPKSKDGIGMALLCKMGWQPGQGLGKNNEGVVEPLIPELKLDTKGLITEEEKALNRRSNVVNMYNIPQTAPKANANMGNNSNASSNSSKIETKINETNCEKLTAVTNQSIINGKHPVNVLQEVCSKRKWKAPTYTIVNEDGPAHKKSFLIKCTLNQVDYLPSFSSPNKKMAKAIAALVCLQAFGLVNLDEM